MNPVDAYAEAVVEGRIPAGKLHRLACARHIADRRREGTDAFPYRFDAARATRFVAFVQKLKHYKGEWAGSAIRLEPWQVFILGSSVAWLHIRTGLRRFRTAYVEIPRKNGKSTLAGAVGLYFSFFDGEPGAEGYCIATKREQAKIVFADAKQFVVSSGLKSRIGVRVANLHSAASNSKLEPLGADHDSTDGLNPHLIITDEFHAMKNRGLIDVMETATGARRQPFHFQITTAGDDPVSPCGDQHEYARKVLEGALEDESFFAFVAHADEGDDWLDPATWAKANPNYGVSVKPDDLAALAHKARHMPAAAASFKQKRINLWVNTSAPWLSMDGWRAGQQRDAKGRTREAFERALEHEPCYVGIDLAAALDLMALVAVFPPTPGRPWWAWVTRVWTPADTLAERAHRDRAPYQVWVEQGHLETCPGTQINTNVIREALADFRQRFTIERVGFDPWHATRLILDLVEEDGFAEDQVLAVPQTYQGMSAGCKLVEGEVLAGNVDANGCPVTSWAASNAVVQSDNKGNIYPVKKRSKGRIDPLMAACIGTSLYERLGQSSAASRYERGEGFASF